ncbi:MAG: Ig-like domain-containing protein [Actinobacteria bacterium]|nr:Ig-like domain-containing protein [Actinomycetota bacterium]
MGTFAATALAVAAVLAMADSAAAQTSSVPTLFGEELYSCANTPVSGCRSGLNEQGTQAFQVRCNADGSGTISWQATGLAIGPYSGFFTESGRADFGSGDPLSVGKPLTSVQITFRIESPLGVVEGRKYLSEPSPPLNYGFGRCSLTSLQAGASSGILRYEAVIYPSTGGSFQDEGRAYFHVFTFGSQTTGQEELLSDAGQVLEYFYSDLAGSVTVAPATDTNTVGDQHCVTATVRNAYLINQSDVNVVFSVTGANPQTSSTRTTDANGQAIYCYTGTNVGTDTITAAADVDRDGTVEPLEPSGTATKIYIGANPTTVTVSPTSDTNTVGDQHCVTATARDASGNPSANYRVFFTVTGTTLGRTASSGSAVTNASGEATFCYTAQFPGTDTISAVVDADKDGTAEATEPRGTATKVYVLPVSTPLCQVSISDGGWITAANGDRASFGGNAKVAKNGSTQGEQVYQDHGPAQPFTVKSTNILAVTCSGTEATIYGTATIDGVGQFFFRIQVSDVTKSGKGDRYGILLSNGYYSGDQPLRGGNITILRK